MKDTFNIEVKRLREVVFHSNMTDVFTSAVLPVDMADLPDDYEGIPKDATAYFIRERYVGQTPDGVKLSSESKDVHPYTFINARILTPEEVKTKVAKNSQRTVAEWAERGWSVLWLNDGSITSYRPRDPAPMRRFASLTAA